MGLEGCYTGYSKMDVFSPPGNYWIWRKSDVPPFFEEILKFFPHFVLELLANVLKSIDDWLSDECVGILCAIPAGFPVLISSPKSGAGNSAGLAKVSRIFPEGNFYFSKGHCVPLGQPIG